MENNSNIAGQSLSLSLSLLHLYLRLYLSVCLPEREMKITTDCCDTRTQIKKVGVYKHKNKAAREKEAGFEPSVELTGTSPHIKRRPDPREPNS